MRASRLLIGSVLALAAATAYAALRDRGSGSAEGAGAAPPRPVPVTASTVEERDFPIYRVGLGTVQAYNTVTVKVRVDGEVARYSPNPGQLTT
jgi:multidrug efflux system membrane fusion protein